MPLLEQEVRHNTYRNDQLVKITALTNYNAGIVEDGISHAHVRCLAVLSEELEWSHQVLVSE